MTVLSTCLKLTLAAALVAALSPPAASVDTSGFGYGTSFGKARVLLQNEKWSEAAALLRTVVADNPTNVDAHSLLGFALRKTGDYEAAQGLYARALELNPRHRGTLEYLGELYVEIGQPDKAQQQLVALEQACGNTSCDEYRQLAEFIAANG